MYSTHSHLKRLYSRDSQILAFLDFQYLTMNLDWQKNSKIKLGKIFFCIFMSSYAEIGFYGQKTNTILHFWNQLQIPDLLILLLAHSENKI
jgi:hypothetical protein